MCIRDRVNYIAFVHNLHFHGSSRMRLVECDIQIKISVFITICPYYTFSVKGFHENYAVFAPNSRSLQEQQEEKVFGLIPKEKQKRSEEHTSELQSQR